MSHNYSFKIFRSSGQYSFLRSLQKTKSLNSAPKSVLISRSSSLDYCERTSMMTFSCTILYTGYCLVSSHRSVWYFSVFSVSFFARLSNHGQLIFTATTLISFLWLTNHQSTLCVLCVNRNISVCLSVVWQVQRAELHSWVPRRRRVGKLEVP